jgi:hypothetical protein
MPSQAKLLERQLAKLHDDDMRTAPAPIPVHLMPGIAQDATDLMLSQDPRRIRPPSVPINYPGFFDGPSESWPDLEKKLDHRSLGEVFQLESGVED